MNFNTTPKLITLCLIGLSLIPRLLSTYAWKPGSMYILLFWLPILVILPEIFKDFEIKKKLRGYEYYSLSGIVLIVFIISLSFLYRKSIYDSDADSFATIVRRSLYLLNPMICMIWYLEISKDKRKYYLSLLFFLTLTSILFMLVPQILRETIIANKFNELTAQTAAAFLDIFIDVVFEVNGSFIGNSNFSVLVEYGCSSVNQITISLYCMIVFYSCCKLKSKIKIISVIFITIAISFFLNSVRISILVNYVLKEKMNIFDFWHDGMGSLVFSFIIIFFCSLSYYILWCSENPVNNENRTNE